MCVHTRVIYVDDVNVRPAGMKNGISTPYEREFGATGSKGLRCRSRYQLRWSRTDPANERLSSPTPRDIANRFFFYLFFRARLYTCARAFQYASIQFDDRGRRRRRSISLMASDFLDTYTWFNQHQVHTHTYTETYARTPVTAWRKIFKTDNETRFNSVRIIRGLFFPSTFAISGVNTVRVLRLKLQSVYRFPWAGDY